MADTVTARPDVFTKWVLGVVASLLVAGIVALLSMTFSQGNDVAGMRTDVAHQGDQIRDLNEQLRAIDQTQRMLIDNVVSRVTRLEIEAAQMREKIDRLQKP